MQIRVFNIAIPGGEETNEEMNALLRAKRVLQVEHHIVTNDSGSYWCFMVKYIDMAPPSEAKPKVDYREVLDEIAFGRFAKYREIRKKISKDENIPAFAVFTDEELAEMAKVEKLTLAEMKKLKGVGDKRTEKYGPLFVEKNETSQ
jgi:superfamily II DNA helicase RecQ